MNYRMGALSQTVYAQVEEQGFTAPVVHSALPRVPSDITSVGSDELMELFVQLTEYTNFANTQVAYAKIDERRAESRASDKFNTLMSDASAGAKERVTFQKSQSASHPEYVKLREVAEHATAYRQLMEAMLENLDRDARLVSRELTRRTSSTEARSNRWSA
jgi:uncharacterized protein YxeA